MRKVERVHWPCDDPRRWGARIFSALLVDCPCCTFFRGVALGFLCGLVVAGAITLALR